MPKPGAIRVAADHERRYRGANKLATEVAVNLLRAECLLSAELNRRFRRHGLSVATFNVLMILEGTPEPLTPAQIGDRLLVTRGTVTGLLDSLEKCGLIARSVHPEDRRMLLITVTSKGRTLLAEVWKEHWPAEAKLISGLSATEKDALVRLLGKLHSSLAARAG
ncbi:MAG: MarR family winged helix-turn-helix transcriptional regulator [Actinomycetota bacterium]